MNIKKEIKKFNKLIKKYPNIREFYVGRAKLYGEIRQYKKSFQDYKKTQEYFISNDIADICERNNLIKEAEILYKNAIKEDEKNSINYVRRAYFYMRNGKNEKAIYDCKIALKLSPKNKTILTLAEMLIKKFLNSKS